jgi:uncharacterized SAM-binding protein YcdF (DUF218 family)
MRSGSQPSNQIRSGVEQYALFRYLRAALAILGALVVLTLLLPPRWYPEILAGEWRDPKGPVLIVLAADTSASGLLGESSYWRALYGVRAWREGGFKKVILSGEAAGAMREFMIGEGIPADAIVIENRSHSTHENAEFAVPVLKQFAGPYVLMTSDYHMFRAHRAFIKAGVAVLPRPFPDAVKRMNSWRWRWTVAVELATETVKIVYYQLRGWI